MREILFRGKRENGRGWICGNLVKQISGAYIVSEKITGCIADYIKHEVDPETVCQYTGLTDKNGGNIFEGDIVRDIFNAFVVGIVRYGEYRNTFNDDKHGGHAGFYIEWQDKKDLLRKDLVYWVKNSEFIGNIFDNPELIGDKP